MRRLSLIVAVAMVSAGVGTAHGAQCQGADGKWYDYSSPQCGGPGDVQAGAGRSASYEDRKLGIVETHKSLVRAHLKDPDSATFSMIRTTSGTTCGYVNAKNSYGAYTGDKPFVVLSAGGKTHVLMDGDVFGAQIQSNGVFISASTYATPCFRAKVVEP